MIQEALPHSLEAEQCLLGAILINQEALDVVDGVLVPDDFAEPLNQFLFARMIEARGSGRRIDFKLLCASLGELGKQDYDGRTVREYVAHLAAEATTVLNSPDYARVIRDLADKRRLNTTADVLKAAVRGDQSATQVANNAIEQLDEIVSAQSDASARRISIGDAADTALRCMQEAMRNPGKPTGLTTGLHDLDFRTGGLHRGELIILGGRPGMGKSAVAVTVSRLMAGAGHHSLLFSLEMSGPSLADRALADIAFDNRDPISYWDITRGDLSNEQAERIIEAGRALRALPLAIEQQGQLSVAQIAARARKYKNHLERKGKTLDALFVDHLQLVRASDRYRGNRVSELTEISGGLKALAKELNVAVIALAQLSRQVEGRDNKRPLLSDLRDSGSIEQDADVVLFVFREAYYLEQLKCDDDLAEQKRLARLMDVRHRLEINVAKHRNGPTGTVELFCDAACNAIRDLAGVGR